MGAYLKTQVAHRHILPPGEEWSTAASMRECFKDGTCHTAGHKVFCDVEGCDKFMGTHCIDCRKVV